jgi:integrase
MSKISLTTAYVKALQPPVSGRVEIWDEKLPGLCIRLSATGKGAWTYRYRPREGAGYQRLTLGPLDALTLAEARDRAARTRLRVLDGADPQGERRLRRREARVLTFEALAKRYLEEYAKPRKSSWKNDEQNLKRPRAAWGARPASSITRRDAIALLDDIKVEAPVSANRTQSILSGLFNWAIEDELVDANPLASLRKRAAEKPKERTLSDAELAMIFIALAPPAGISNDAADALRVLMLTGQRPGEVAGMEQAELVDLDDPGMARWEIPAHRMKARRAHVSPLPPLSVKIIKEALARRRSESESRFVFASRLSKRGSLGRATLSQGLRRSIALLVPSEGDGRQSATIALLQSERPTPHDMRRTVATGLARLGIVREDRMAVLAHVAGDVHGSHYDRYERLREKRIALEAWERHVRSTIGEPLEIANVTLIRSA